MITNKIEVVLDFETFCHLDIKKVSAREYAEHASIFCLGYKINNNPGRIWIPERGKMPDDLWQAIKSGAILIAQNAGFEIAIIKFCLIRYPLLTSEQREYLLNLAISRWKCTAAKAAACSLPRSLDGSSNALELPVRKDKRGNDLIKKYCKPRKASKHNKKAIWDNKNDLRLIYKYCITDLEVEYALDKSIPDLSPTEQRIWELDQTVNARGILIDIPLVHQIIGMIKEEIGEITKEVRRLSNGTVEKATQREKVLEWINARGADLPNLTAQTVRDYLEQDDIDSKVRMMLEYRQACSKTSTAKYNAMIRAVNEDHRARELLLYGGATPTMRWAGKRLQPQNFPRPTPALQKIGFKSDEAIEIIKRDGLLGIRKKYGKTKVMDVLASCLRGAFIASPGCEMFQADWAQVEARLAFWFARCEIGIQQFRNGEKLYEQMAADTFKMRLEDIGKDSLERFVGKESILGCQYGLGFLKFLSQCHKKDMKSVTKEIAKKAVEAYRAKYKEVPQAWKDLEVAIVSAIQNPGKVYKTTRVSIYKKGRFLFIKLPSGRKLKYFKPRVTYKQSWGRMVPEIRYWAMDWKQSTDINPKTGKYIMRKVWCEIVCWGGIFFNHIVQGTSRDLMANGMIAVEEAGYNFLISIHDEGLSERKKGCGNTEEYVKLMSSLPAWIGDAPLKMEGWKNDRYRK